MKTILRIALAGVGAAAGAGLGFVVSFCVSFAICGVIAAVTGDENMMNLMWVFMIPIGLAGLGAGVGGLIYGWRLGGRMSKRGA